MQITILLDVGFHVVRCTNMNHLSDICTVQFKPIPKATVVQTIQRGGSDVNEDII